MFYTLQVLPIIFPLKLFHSQIAFLYTKYFVLTFSINVVSTLSNKTVSWLSYLYIGNPCTRKDHLYIETGPRSSNELQWLDLTHCGLVTLYGDTDIGQHWLR